MSRPLGRAPALLLAACLLLTALVASPGCGSDDRTALIVATTTSAEDSGILERFVSEFEERYPYDVKAVAVGSGSALFMGRNGDADVMLTHEPKAEREFMAAGYGESNRKVMHNDFVIVGPKDDPAGIRGTKDAAAAFKKIADGRYPFVSRGDASGTNAKEMETWEKAAVKPGGDWYTTSGQSMGATMRIAAEKGAYTLCDRATYIVMKESLPMDLLVEGDPSLLNQYTVTVVNPKHSDRVNAKGARLFAEYLLSPGTQEMIKEYGLDEYGKHLFYPD